MIDPHVHLRDGVQSSKETLEHGLLIASSLGIRVVFDMPNTDPPLTGSDEVVKRLQAGREAARKVSDSTARDPVWYGVYGGLTSDPLQIREIVDTYWNLRPAMVGLKLFAGHSTGAMGVVDADSQETVYRVLTDCGYTGVLAVHCEKESLLLPSAWDPGFPETHCDARPPEAEIQSIADQIAYVKASGFAGLLHICHISTAESIVLVANARQQGLHITCGATAHHALLDRRIVGMEGNLLKMNPPLRSPEDRNAVFTGLLDGTVDWIESDHAPHTLADKSAGASGIPGFAGYALLLASLQAAGVAPERLKKLCGDRLRQAWHMPMLPHAMVPESSSIGNALHEARTAYPWDPFASIVFPGE